MKKVMALLLAALLLMGMMAGCGSDKEESGTSKKGAAEAATVEPGKYLAVSCFDEDGVEYFCDEDWIIIEEGGTGIIVFEGTEYEMDWVLDGSEFSFEDVDGDTFEGTYENGSIEGWYGGVYEYVFERDAGGKKGAAAEEPAEEPEKGADSTGFEPVSANIGGYDIAVVGAELFTDTEDKDGIRVYWDFTNTSDETVNAYRDLSVYMEQEGYELTTTYVYSEDDVPEYGNDSLELRPGVAIRCISEYNCKADGGLITFRIYDWYDEEDALEVDFDPAALPGRPAEDLVPETVDDPDWTEGFALEGSVGEEAYVVIETAEVVPGWDSGEEVIRVYFQFTNEAEEAASFWWNTYYRAFQDGVELVEDLADEDVAEDDNTSLEIEPGETVRCAVCWELRSDSPVELEVYDLWSEETIGCVFDVTE